MRNRFVLPAAVAVVALAFSAGAVVGKGDRLRHLNLPGRSDDRPFTHTVVAGETI